MVHKLIRIQRDTRWDSPRPVMIAIAGDSAAGKTTLTAGLVRALGADRVTAICVDDYHRYDRYERKSLPFTALHPSCNYLDVMEQHLQLLATGQSVLKPVYDHDTGLLTRPELIQPREFVIVEGLMPLHSRLSRACFDISIYLDPPEEVRRQWKVQRDTAKRGYTVEAVLAELERREPESAAHIRPQRAEADIVVRFGPIASRQDPPETPLSVELLLRPTIRHPDLTALLEDSDRQALHLKLTRDEDGRPVDTLHVHGYAPLEQSARVRDGLWSLMGVDGDRPPESLGDLGNGANSAPLAITQLLLLYHMLDAMRSQPARL